MSNIKYKLGSVKLDVQLFNQCLTHKGEMSGCWQCCNLSSLTHFRHLAHPRNKSCSCETLFSITWLYPKSICGRTPEQVDDSSSSKVGPAAHSTDKALNDCSYYPGARHRAMPRAIITTTWRACNKMGHWHGRKRTKSSVARHVGESIRAPEKVQCQLSYYQASRASGLIEPTIV